MPENTNIASVQDTKERCGLADRDWDRLDTPIKLLLREAVKLVQAPAISGMYYVTASNDDGEETQVFVAADSFEAAIAQFCDWSDCPLEDWCDSPRAYLIEYKPQGRHKVIEWHRLNAMTGNGYRTGPHAE
jgi:hypothetical protein